MPKLGQRSDPIPRFVAKVDFAEECWVWTAGVNQFGYGKFTPSPERGLVFAHRFAWEQFVGPIPEGCVIDHLCRNPRCVNPDHLEPVTQLENVRRGAHVQKSHCANGHPRTPQNQYLFSDGSRRCRLCTQEHNAAKREGRQPATSYRRDVPTKDCCKHGHPYDEANTLISGGRKYCRACLYAGNKRRREAKKEAALRARKGA